MRSAVAGLVVLTGLLVAAVLWLRDEVPGSATAPVATVASLLGDSDADDGFRRAALPGGIKLPQDHGPHDDYRTEWWYFTGNLATAGGREFGFQLTFFRFALAQPRERASAWATNQVYMAHFALTDRTNDTHEVEERFARGSTGLAGARHPPFRVWLDDWSAESTSTDFLPLRLSARDIDTGLALDLSLAPGKEPVLQGANGLSAKGKAPGNASWYFSYTRLPATGVVEIGGSRHEVTGLAWLDREWSTSSLDAGVVGWDWFSLQLDDGRDVMLYSLRQADGGSAPESAGSVVSLDGSRTALRNADFQLEARRYWRSPSSGVSWPVDWRVRIPAHDLDLRVVAALSDQEQSLAVRYWEGSVDILPADGNARIGRGYMELTGYRLPPANSRR
jgi:predicted secreted hydrolase